MKNSINTILQEVKNRFKNRKIIQSFLEILAGFGIYINPYYVYQEDLPRSVLRDFGPGFEKYETVFLAIEDMKIIGNIEGRKAREETFRNRLKKGNKCLAVKKGDEIVAYSWCNLDVFDHPPERGFKLNANEAYLFDAYTLREYRGHSIAPFMRHSCYQELSKSGRNTLYSYSDYFNAPAIRFKTKLNARRLRLCLYIRLFNRFSGHWQLKKYADVSSNRVN